MHSPATIPLRPPQITVLAHPTNGFMSLLVQVTESADWIISNGTMLDLDRVTHLGNVSVVLRTRPLTGLNDGMIYLPSGSRQPRAHPGESGDAVVAQDLVVGYFEGRIWVVKAVNAVKEAEGQSTQGLAQLPLADGRVVVGMAYGNGPESVSVTLRTAVPPTALGYGWFLVLPPKSPRGSITFNGYDNEGRDKRVTVPIGGA